jgi:hypothetical protein
MLLGPRATLSSLSKEKWHKLKMFEKYDIMLFFLKQEWSEILIQSIRDNIILIMKVI